MRRRPRIDLGQGTSNKGEATLERKRARWAARNKDLPPEDNPFLIAIKPHQEQYGDPDENIDELKARLNNQEFGNFPGYFNYRNKAAVEGVKNETDHSKKDESQQSCTDNKCDRDETTAGDFVQPDKPLESGLSDERINYLRKEWFVGKTVLDIGCNRGHITYAIARLFNPAMVIGIDIDLKMVNMANKDLHLYLEDVIIKEAREKRFRHAARLKLDDSTLESYPEDSNQFPLASYSSHGPLALIREKDSTEEGSMFPNNIVFLEHNYVLANDELVAKQKPQFDTITCLSVTKWIHLNYRDDGLKRFFKRIYNHLQPGGLLILEAQPFDNYGRRRKLSDRLKSNFYSIQFKPDQFDDYLLSKQVGFREIIHESVTDHQCAGFKRPLKVFLK